MKRSSGALEERCGKGQKASTYLSYIVEDVAAVEVRGATGPHGEPAAHLHAESEHTKRSSGALESSEVRDSANAHGVRILRREGTQSVQRGAGVSSGTGHKAGALMLGSRTHCSRRDWLRRHQRRRARRQSHPVCKRRAHETFQRGDGGKVSRGSKCELTELA